MKPTPKNYYPTTKLRHFPIIKTTIKTVSVSGWKQHSVKAELNF